MDLFYINHVALKVTAVWRVVCYPILIYVMLRLWEQYGLLER